MPQPFKKKEEEKIQAQIHLSMFIHPVTGKPCKVPAKGFRFSEKTMREMIAQTVAEVLAEYNLQNEQPEQDLYLTLQIGDNTIIDTVVKAINRKTRNNGKEVILSL